MSSVEQTMGVVIWSCLHLCRDSDTSVGSMLPPQISGRARIQDADAAIRQTDDDAALARRSAVSKGYLTDPFVEHLASGRLQLRPPLINIGTYVRSHSIDHLAGEWMKICKQKHRPCQIVSLGSGSDTRFWRIAVRLLASPPHLRLTMNRASADWSIQGAITGVPRT